MTEPMDMSQDPDRFVAGPEKSSSLDLSRDPDRFDTAGQTLPELLGDGAYEDKRDNLTWLIGLVCVIGFLVLVSLLIQLR